MSVPMTETWKMTVLEVHGLYNGDKEVIPDDVRNAVGSTLADALVENYHDSFNRSELTEDEVKLICGYQASRQKLFGEREELDGNSCLSQDMGVAPTLLPGYEDPVTKKKEWEHPTLKKK